MELNGIRPTQPAQGTTRVESKTGNVTRSSESHHGGESDRVELSKEAESIMSYVQQVKEMPEVRSEVVESFKSRIRDGNYPPPAIIEGLMYLMGSVFRKTSGS